MVEEADAFAMSDDDVGCVSELEMDIELTSDQPVQKALSGSLSRHSQVVLSVLARKMVQ